MDPYSTHMEYGIRVHFQGSIDAEGSHILVLSYKLEVSTINIIWLYKMTE